MLGLTGILFWFTLREGSMPSAVVTIGLLIQFAALWLMHMTVEGRWLKHSGAMLLAMATLYHGFTEIMQWLMPGRNAVRLQATQASINTWVLLVSVGLLVYSAAYSISMHRRPVSASEELRIDSIGGLQIRWLLVMSAPFVLLSVQGRGALQAAGFTGSPVVSQNYVTAGLATQFLVFTLALTGVVILAKVGGRWLLPWLAIQTLLLSFVGVRSIMVVGAVLVLYGAIRLNVQLPRKSLVAALLLLVLIGATISSARAVSGRESFLANHTAGDRLAALADGFVALPTAHSRQATVDAFAGRFDGNTFGALVGAGLDAGRPPVGFATVRNDVLLTVPSFLNPAKLDAPIEQRNEDAYFVKHFGLHFGTDYLPGLFGFMLGYLGKIGLPVLAALFGILFAFLDRWLLRRVNRARLLISFGLMESVLFYGQLPAGFLLVGRGVLVFVIVVGVAALVHSGGRRVRNFGVAGTSSGQSPGESHKDCVPGSSDLDGQRAFRG